MRQVFSAVCRPGAGTPVVVSGWGRTRSGAPALELQYVVLHVLPVDKCAQELPGDLRAKLHLESSLCTLTPEKDHCKGELGVDRRITGFLHRGLWRTHCSKKGRTRNYYNFMRHKNKPGMNSANNSFI